MSTLKILLIQHDDVKCFDKLKTRQDKTPGNVEGGGGGHNYTIYSNLRIFAC